jgi:hypothetical protein
MAWFRKVFGAKKISAYTWSIDMHPHAITFPKGTDEATIQNALKSYEEFIIPAPNRSTIVAECAKRPISKTFILAYGSQDGSKAKFPLGLGDERKYKPLKDAEKRQMTLEQANKMVLETEYEHTPVFPFLHVIAQ